MYVCLFTSCQALVTAPFTMQASQAGTVVASPPIQAHLVERAAGIIIIVERHGQNNVKVEKSPVLQRALFSCHLLR
jgi:hypothetical protein